MNYWESLYLELRLSLRFWLNRIDITEAQKPSAQIDQLSLYSVILSITYVDFRNMTSLRASHAVCRDELFGLNSAKHNE